MSRPEKGSEVEVLVDSLAFGGRGVARLDDFVLFVDRALPGDRVRARVTKVKRSYGEATTVEMLAPGPDRVIAPCPHFGACGGCKWQDLDYSAQQVWKAQQIADVLKRIGHQDDFVQDPIVPAIRTYGYRNKLEFSFGETEEGPSLGFHRAGRWDEIMPVTACLLMSEAGNEARRVVEAWARRTNGEIWDRRSNTGYLRHLVVRASDRTGELLLTLVTAPGAHHDAGLARLLVEHGADPNARASLRKYDHEYRDITPLAWGQRFHTREFVNEQAMRAIAERGGHA